MKTSLPLFCKEEEEPCRDVNNSLPPVVERGVDHEGMSHAGRGGGCGEGIKRRFFLCSCGSPVSRVRVLSPVRGVSFLLRREQSFSRPSGPAWLAWLEAFGSFLLRLAQ